jgi:hypothetical protein
MPWAGFPPVRVTFAECGDRLSMANSNITRRGRLLQPSTMSAARPNLFRIMEVRQEVIFCGRGSVQKKLLMGVETTLHDLLSALQFPQE